MVYTPSVGSTVLVREGDLAPDCGFATYGDGTASSRPIPCRGFGFFGAGWYSSITGQGVSSVNDTALFVGNAAAASLVVREGSVNPSLPGSERVSSILPTPAYSDFEGGSVAFYAVLSGPGVTVFDDTALILGRPGHLEFVAREGGPAPGFETVPNFVRAVFGNASSGLAGITPGVVLLNDRGQVHFNQVLVTVTTTQGSVVHLCGYVHDPTLGLRLLVDGGQVAPRVAGDVLVGAYGAQPVIGVTASANPTGDGGTLMLTADGDLAMRAQYSTGNGHGAILRTKLGALDGRPVELSATLGGVHTMPLDGGLANAGMLYVVAATASGTRPGSGYGNAIVPLNPDALFVESILMLNSGPGIPWGRTFGLLDASGRGTATFTMPSGLPQFAGLEIHHAMVVLDFALAPRLVSPPCGLRLR